jgi:sterol desaturase/sphingolipid hydroxylase (fatty acid hydroxylase superfamily)
MGNLAEGFSYLFQKFEKLLLSPGSAFSLTSLACALGIAVGFLIIKRRQKNRPIRIKTLARALFPKRITGSPSHSLDVGYFFLNTLVFVLIFGGAVLSYQVVGNAVIGRLVAIFGNTEPTALPDLAARIVITVTLFFAYELAYWSNHYLSHRVPFLWEFHKVHHEATVLTPLTNFRIHPADALLHANMTAIFMGTTNGAMNYLFGKTTYQYAIGDGNAIFVLFMHAYVHLQHTHLWIPFRGVLGRIFLSPAHHQIHHSTDPVHFNKNLGSCLAVWDWMFGTLHVPAKEPEKLRFGMTAADGTLQSDQRFHSVTRSLLKPCLAVLSQLKPVAGAHRGDEAEGTARASRPARGWLSF